MAHADPPEREAEANEGCLILEPPEEAVASARRAAGVAQVLKAYVVMQEPSIALIPGFVSDAEINHLLGLAETAGAWVPSVVWRGGEPTQRTSSSFMLESAQDAIVEAIEHRAASAAGVPVEYVERLNIVKYTPGQFFGRHHDGRNRPKTVFLYLNDVPDGGGETHFPNINVKIKPIRGCAAVWSNLLDGVMDKRLEHQGLPPAKGEKYGLNAFICSVPRGAPNVDCHGESLEEYWSRSSLGNRLVRQLNFEKYFNAVLKPKASTNGDNGSATLRTMRRFQITTKPSFRACPDFLLGFEIRAILEAACKLNDDCWRPANFDSNRGNSEVIDFLADEFRLKLPGSMADNLLVRIALALGVNKELLDELQIERYLPGQWTFERHAGPGRTDSIMVYLDDAIEGEDGASDFKHASVAFLPHAGTALLWHNLWDDGSGDPRLSHSEVPLKQTVRYRLMCHARTAADAQTGQRIWNAASDDWLNHRPHESVVF